MSAKEKEAKSERRTYRFKPSVLAHLEKICDQKKRNEGEVLEWLIMTTPAR